MSAGQSTAPAGAALRLRAARATPIGAPIHQSLVNPILVMGMERGPGVTLLTTVAALILGPGIHTYTIVIAVLLLIFGRWALGKLAEYDPECEALLIRYSTYARVYEAESPLAAHKSIWEQISELTDMMPSPLAGARRPAVPTVSEIKGKVFS
jgi:type IV secretory pathway TrbD component